MNRINNVYEKINIDPIFLEETIEKINNDKKNQNPTKHKWQISGIAAAIILSVGILCYFIFNMNNYNTNTIISVDTIKLGDQAGDIYATENIEESDSKTIINFSDDLSELVFYYITFYIDSDNVSNIIPSSINNHKYFIVHTSNHEYSYYEMNQEIIIKYKEFKKSAATSPSFPYAIRKCYLYDSKEKDKNYVKYIIVNGTGSPIITNKYSNKLDDIITLKIKHTIGTIEEIKYSITYEDNKVIIEKID